MHHKSRSIIHSDALRAASRVLRKEVLLSGCVAACLADVALQCDFIVNSVLATYLPAAHLYCVRWERFA